MVKNKVRNKDKGILQVTLTVCISFTNVTSHNKACVVLWIHKSVWALLQTRQVAMKINSSLFLFLQKATKISATQNYEEQIWHKEKIKVRITVVCEGSILINITTDCSTHSRSPPPPPSSCFRSFHSQL
jgi:hypothetical protein